jgi:hypothetical protein
MKRRLLWLVALAGVVWLYLRRGARRPESVDRVPAPADPAEELRRKLDETKDREPELSYPAVPEPDPADVLGVEQPSPSAPAEPGQPSAPVVSEELDARRREIHEQARTAADDMRGTSSD